MVAEDQRGGLMGEIVGVRVRGLGKAIRALEKAGADSEQMRDLMHEIGEIVAVRARQLAPVGKSRRLKASIRAGRGKTKAVVRAGYERKSMPYAGVVHYGWPARNILPDRFLADAMDQTRGEVIARLDTGIGGLLERNSLK